MFEGTSLIAWLGFTLSMIIFVYNIVTNKNKASKEEKATLKGNIESLEQHYEELNGKVIAIETKVDVFWKNVTYSAAAGLHSPHPEFKDRDILLEKYMDDTISDRDLERLYAMLEEIIENESSLAGQKLSANILIADIKNKYQTK
jgi:hypothetical protein